MNELDRIVEWAEDLCGVGHKAWGTVDPRLVASAVLEAADNLNPTRKPLTDLKEALVEAVSIINHYGMHGWSKEAHDEGERVIRDARKALSASPAHPKAEQEPKREWVGLTDEERDEIYLAVELGACGEELIEAKLKEKNA